MLSTPLTVCLVVLGRYVPHLEFLHIILVTNLFYYPRPSFISGCWQWTNEKRTPSLIHFSRIDRYLGFTTTS